MMDERWREGKSKYDPFTWPCFPVNAELGYDLWLTSFWNITSHRTGASFANTKIKFRISTFLRHGLATLRMHWRAVRTQFASFAAFRNSVCACVWGCAQSVMVRECESRSRPNPYVAAPVSAVVKVWLDKNGFFIDIDIVGSLWNTEVISPSIIFRFPKLVPQELFTQIKILNSI